MEHPPSPERLISLEIEKFLAGFHKLETPHALQAALWNFGAQVYNVGSSMGGRVDPKYGPPVVVIERILDSMKERDMTALARAG